MFRRLKIIIFYSSLLFCSPNYLMNLLPRFHLLLFHSLIPFFSHFSLTSQYLFPFLIQLFFIPRLPHFLFHSLIQLFSFLAYLSFYFTPSLCSFPIPRLVFFSFPTSYFNSNLPLLISSFSSLLPSPSSLVLLTYLPLLSPPFYPSLLPSLLPFIS